MANSSGPRAGRRALAAAAAATLLANTPTAEAASVQTAASIDRLARVHPEALVNDDPLPVSQCIRQTLAPDGGDVAAKLIYKSNGDKIFQYWPKADEKALVAPGSEDKDVRVVSMETNPQSDKILAVSYSSSTNYSNPGDNYLVSGTVDRGSDGSPRKYLDPLDNKEAAGGSASEVIQHQNQVATHGIEEVSACMAQTPGGLTNVLAASSHDKPPSVRVPRVRLPGAAP